MKRRNFIKALGIASVLTAGLTNAKSLDSTNSAPAIQLEDIYFRERGAAPDIGKYYRIHQEVSVVVSSKNGDFKTVEELEIWMDNNKWEKLSITFESRPKSNASVYPNTLSDYFNWLSKYQDKNVFITVKCYSV